MRVINAIEAAKLIVRDLTRKGIRFAMGGDAPSGEQKEALSVEMSLAKYVALLGRLPDEVFLSVLSRVDVRVIPDRIKPMDNPCGMKKTLVADAGTASREPLLIEVGSDVHQDGSG